MEKVIYIEADEEITSVISRVKKIKNLKVALVIPKGSVILGSIVNLKMLKKYEKDLKKEITVVTTDRAGRHIASQVGFPVIHSLDEANKETSEKPAPAALGPRVEFKSKDELSQKEKPLKYEPQITFKEIKDEVSSAPDLKERGIEKASLSKRRKLSKTAKRVFWGFRIFGFMAAVLVVLFVLPKAVIIISPRAEELREEVFLEIKINPQNSNILPGELVETTQESSKNYPTTGKKNVGEKAKGTITVYNEWDSNVQPLVAGTRFLSSDGKLFRTTQAVNVPGTTVQTGNIVPGTANVEVEADQPGDAYNIGPSKFTIPGLPADKQAKIYGKSTSVMAGGSSKEIKVVSKQDIEHAKNSLNEEMVSKANEDLSKKAGDKKILEAAIKEDLIEEKLSANEGQEAQEFILTQKKNFWTISFKEEKAKEKITAKLKETLPENKELVEGRLDNIEYKVVDITKENGLSVTVSVIGYVTEKLELGKAKNDLPGKTKEEVIQYFKQKEEITDVKVDFWPFWVSKVPPNYSRIEIKINIFVAK